LDFIMKLQPVSYNFNRVKYSHHIGEQLTPDLEGKLTELSRKRTVGFIAQAVEEAIRETGFSSFDAVHAPTNETDTYSLGYAEFVVPLVKAMQELNNKVEELKNENIQLKDKINQSELLNGNILPQNEIAELQRTNQELTLRIEKLESMMKSKK